MTKEPVNPKKRAATVVLWLAPIVGFGPAILAGIGASTTPGCTNEGNCTALVLPWLTMLTMPLGVGILIVGMIMYTVAKRDDEPRV